MVMRVAGFQMAVQNDVQANLRSILEGIDRAAQDDVEILLTPEGSLSGYTHEFDPPAVTDALEKVVRHARNQDVGLALGTCFLEDDGKCYNQLRFYRPDGEYLGFHSKTLCCGTLEDAPQGEINRYASAPLRVFDWRDGIIIGGLICNDMWANPECTPVPDSHLSQQLARMGARVLFHAANGGRDGSDWSRLTWTYHEANLRMRARAGNLWIVTVDSAYPVHLPCSAPSGVINPDGAFLSRAAPKGPQLFACDIPV